MIAIGIGGIVNREDHCYAPGVSVIMIDRGSESSSATGGEVTISKFQQYSKRGGVGWHRTTPLRETRGPRGRWRSTGGCAGADEPEEPKVKREEEVMDMDVLPLSSEDPMKGPSDREQPGRYIHHAFIDLEMEAAESSSDVRARVFEQDLARNVVRIKDRDLDYKNDIYNINKRETAQQVKLCRAPARLGRRRGTSA